MNTGQTMMTIFALVLLATLLTNFYQIVATTGDDIASGQDDILANGVSTSWAEMAQGFAFDNVTDTSDIAFQNASGLTPSGSLHVEPGENIDSVSTYNDFDDFNGATLTKAAGATGKVFTTKFSVYYVNPDDMNTVVGGPTFVKRMDMVTFRSWPVPRKDEMVDTLYHSIVYSYFNFN